MTRRLPPVPVIPDRGRLLAGERAAFDPKSVRILVSRQLIDLVIEQPTPARVWSILSGIRHELKHYEQYLRGARRKPEFDDDDAYLMGDFGQIG